MLKANAQQASAIISPDQNDENNHPEIIGVNDRSFFAISSKTKESFYIESLTVKELRRIFKRQVLLPQIEGKTVNFENILYFNQHIYLLTSLYNKKTKTYTAYLNEVSGGGELSLNHTILDEVTLTEKKHHYAIHFSLSADSNRMLIYREYAESDTTKGKIVYKVVSKGLKTLFTKEIRLSQPFDKITVANALLDTDNNLYYTEKEYLKNETTGAFIKLTIVAYKAEKDTLYRSEIAINENRFLDVHLQFNNKEQLICAGNYASEKASANGWEDSRWMKGVFYGLFDMNDLRLVSKGQKNCQELFPEDKLTKYHLTSTYQLNNGSLIVLCEFQNTVCLDGNCNDIRGPIMATIFHVADQLNTSAQRLVNDPGADKSSCKGVLLFIPFHTEDQVRLLYNCNKQFEINQEGVVTAKALFEDPVPSDLVINSCYYPMNRNELLITTYSKKDGNRFAKLYFKN
ncbi:MAG: hypothetical protein HY062_02940 [Bacteroidetes bacterium]|nr:hypothetical protein [Bacteroidota bacterium]